MAIWTCRHAPAAVEGICYGRSNVPLTVAAGPAAEMNVSRDPFVRQFLDGAPDGPVPFHYPHDTYTTDLGLASPG